MTGPLKTGDWWKTSWRPMIYSRAQIHSQRPINKSPVAAQMIKRSINNITGALDRAFMHMDADQNLFATTMDDQTAAAEAYLNKTAPVFKGE